MAHITLKFGKIILGKHLKNFGPFLQTEKCSKNVFFANPWFDLAETELHARFYQRVLSSLEDGFLR